MTTTEARRYLHSQLDPEYGRNEAEAIIRLIFHALKNWTVTDMLIHDDEPLSDYILQKINDILVRLKHHEPIQYILSEAYFHGMNLLVTPATLIPRPETAELIDIICDNNRDRRDLRVLDIGTGSGCIALALARSLDFPQVEAIDFSPEALKVAEKNAELLHLKVSFFQADIFTWAPSSDSLDIIVSNPPYIDQSEAKDMDPNVIEYEPHTALFVPDNDPIMFYKRIADVAVEALSAAGQLYFEINPHHASEIADYLKDKNFSDIQIILDSHGKQRFITARK